MPRLRPLGTGLQKKAALLEEEEEEEGEAEEAWPRPWPWPSFSGAQGHRIAKSSGSG